MNKKVICLKCFHLSRTNGHKTTCARCVTHRKRKIKKKHMMPGQEEYTPEELRKLNSLIDSAIQAEEQFSEQELEDYIKR